MGPQGTLYGRNTTGGVINIISNQNKSHEFGGFVDVTGGSYSQRILTAALSFPLIQDRAGARVTYRIAERDGYGFNYLLNEDLEDESARLWRININWSPTDDVQVFLSYDDTRQRERSALFHLNYLDPAVQDPACLSEQPPALGCVVNFFVTEGDWSSALLDDPRKIRSDVSSTHDVDVSGISATVTVDFGNNLSFKSITAYRELSRRNINDIDGTEWAILHPDADADQHQVSQEFRLSGETTGGKSNWITGLFLFEEEGNDNTSVISVPDLNPISPSVILPHGENSSYAAYGHIVYSLNADMAITGGLRYTHEERLLDTRQFNGAGCSLEYVNSPPCRTVVSESFGGWSYTGALDYSFTEDLLGYVTLSRGFKSGGFNARATKQVEFEPFDPEIVDNLELGLKSQWLDRSLQLNVAAFYSDYQDIQRAQLIALSPTEIATKVTNAASAYVTGGELQLTALPAPGLAINATAGLTIARYKEFFDIDGQGNVIDKSNLEFPRTPKWNFSLMAQYTLDYLNGITFRADYSWTDKVYNDVNNSELIAQDAVGLLNFRISTEVPDWNLEMALYAKNLTDETYATGGLDFTGQFGYAGVFLGPPRTYHAEVTWRFGAE
jgi:iron complex outermembrane receptor protein